MLTHLIYYALFFCPKSLNPNPEKKTLARALPGIPGEHPQGLAERKIKMARLPRAVEDQGKRADELLKQFGVAQNQLPAATPPGITDPLAAPPIVPATPAPSPDPAEYVNANHDDDIPPAVPPSLEPVTPVPPTPAPQPCAECEKNKQRYSVLQGKYDAEVPRLTYRIQYLENQIADLNGQIQSMAGLTAAHTAQAVVPGPQTPSVFSEALKSSNDEAIKNFRENFPDVFTPLSKILDDFGSQITKKADEKMASIEKNNADTRQEAFSMAIATAQPDWQTICQGDPRWPTWLAKTDAYGLSKLMALRTASAKYDSQVVINLLSDFKKEMAVPPAPNSNPAQNPNARLVSPGSGPSGPGAATPAHQGPEPVARSFILKFAQDVATGKYRGKEEAQKATQAKIDAAVAAGKILNK